MTSVIVPGDFHVGETAMRKALRVPPSENPTRYGLPPAYAMRVSRVHLIAVGTLDALGRPWTSLWGGQRGFARPVAEGFIGMQSPVDTVHDPVYRALWASNPNTRDVRPDPEKGMMMSALAIDLESRDRIKLAGKMAAASNVSDEFGSVQLVMHVHESLGNCPKYLNKKTLMERRPSPELLSDGRGQLPQEAIRLINKADMFFMSSTDGKTMDTNHRGGPMGFVRVVKNEDGLVELVYPECESPDDSGNRLYQTLGNLKIDPLVGIVIPDYETGDALYITGTTSVLLGSEASTVLSKSTLVVKIKVSFARYVKGTLPFTGVATESSPYNPPVRHLPTERPLDYTATEKLDINANLVHRELITPTITVFTFKLESSDPLPKRLPGQHISMNFEMEVSNGYAHMRDDDPQSLNDDYVRTFTVSNPPVAGKEDEVQVIARFKGPVTSFLWRHNVRAPLEVSVLGYGGDESFRLPTTTISLSKEPVYIAGGVGITPLLAQAQAVLDGGVPLTLLWSLSSEDLPLAVHVFDKIPALAAATSLFVTGKSFGSEASLLMDTLKESGAMVADRRIGLLQLNVLKDQGKKFYICAGKEFKEALFEWLAGEDIVSEDFSY